MKRSGTIRGLLLTVTVLLATAAQAQTTDQDLSVSRSLAGSDNSARMAQGPGGNLFVVWRNVVGNDQGRIYASFVKQAGNGQFSASKARPVSAAADQALSPTIALDPISGNLLVGWQNSAAGEFDEIYVRRMQPNARPSGPAMNVTGSDELNKVPLLAPVQSPDDDRGAPRFLLIWDRFQGAGNPHALHSMKLDLDGAPTNAPTEVSEAFADDERELATHAARSLYPGTRGSYVVVSNNEYFRTDRTTGVQTWIGILDADGAPTRHSRVLSEDALRGDAAAASGRMLGGAWLDEGTLRYQRLRARNLSTVRGSLEVAERILSVDLAAAPDGGATLVFLDGQSIFRLHIKANGKPDGDPIRIGAAPGAIQIYEVLHLVDSSRIAILYGLRTAGEDEVRLLVSDVSGEAE